MAKRAFRCENRKSRKQQPTRRRLWHVSVDEGEYGTRRITGKIDPGVHLAESIPA
jgi:hypothetical protein